MERASFYYLKELVLYSFNARIMALFPTYIRNKCNIRKEGAVERYIKGLSPQRFLRHVKDIRIALFGLSVTRDANILTPQQSAIKANR